MMNNYLMLKRSFQKYFLFLFFFFWSSLIFCQNNDTKNIDELLKKAEISRQKFKHLDQLKYAKDALILSQKAENSEKITQSYYTMARALSFLEMQKESFAYANKALNEPYGKKSNLLQAQVSEVKAFNYYSLGLNSQFTKELPNIIKLLKNENNREAIILKQRTYLNLGALKPDSALYYSKLSYDELKKIPERQIHLELSDYYRYMGTDFMDNEKPDSTLYYFNKSFKINLKYKDPVVFQDYTSFGDYFTWQKQYKRAISFYEKAIKNIKDQSIAPYHFHNNSLYKKISDLYGNLGETKKQSEYKKIYTDLQHKLLLEREKNIEEALKVILSDHENFYKTKEKTHYTLIFFLIVIIILLIFIFSRLIYKNLKHKENQISEVKGNLQKKDEIIDQKNTETKELQQKINKAYTDIIDLAKSNDPKFYEYFQEIYPEFQIKILQNSPGLRTSELVLCAYTFLGFTIKDIAEYTSKSINTVRNRKQNLRKKFNIPKEKDMGIWLRELTQTQKN
ncbi:MULTISPECIES: hypothetical protein [unclassified Chryseobacterium]|uniref:helix-turn-helix transcriptional regulator n=1 Tax=unclassified Chryseobacterium TaxID=2593645 RepID=UPI0022699433|nr:MULTISPECIES: hypothetical protein [unclassified Chryseobacterium]